MSAVASLPTDIRDLVDEREIDQVLLVRDAELRKTRSGSSYLRLSLADRTGVLPGVIWDGVERAVELAVPGSPLQVIGRFARHDRYGPQITVDQIEPAADVDWNRLCTGPSATSGELEAELDRLLASIVDPHLAELSRRLLGCDSPTGSAYRLAFAAQYNHHAYRCGLLEHSVQVAAAVDAAAAIFPGVDRDLAVCGALLHDIGKLDAYDNEQSLAQLNDAGRLIGEIPIGYYLVRRTIEQLPGFPPLLAEALLHIILSHHGYLEHGSPVVPATREAILVHAMDALSGDLGSFDRLERESAAGELWSRYDRALDRSVFLASGLSAH